jgi:hypothetical protein
VCRAFGRNSTASSLTKIALDASRPPLPGCLARPWVWLRNQGLRLNTDHLALEQIRWARETDPGDLVVIDAGYGNASQLRASITELGKLRNLRLGLEADFPRDACFAPTRVVFRPVLPQIQPQATGRLAASLASDSDTGTWQLACLPSCPQYWCTTPTECSPLFGKAGIVDDPDFDRSMQQRLMLRRRSLGCRDRCHRLHALLGFRLSRGGVATHKLET